MWHKFDCAFKSSLSYILIISALLIYGRDIADVAPVILTKMELKVSTDL